MGEVGDLRQPYAAGVERIQRPYLGIGRSAAHLPDDERLAVDRNQISKGASDLNTNMHVHFLQM